MSQAYKVLAQVDPVITTLTDAYTVPASTQAIISSIVIANRSATPTSFRVSIAKAGAADATKQYIAYDEAIGANEQIVIQGGISLQTTDVVRVYATLATLSFNIFGVELS